MHITERIVDQDVILSLSGKFVWNARKVFSEAFQQAKKKTSRKIVLNFENLVYIDSAGLGLLAISYEQAQLQNIPLCLVNPVGAVMRIFELTQLPKIIPVYDTEEQALRFSPSVLARAT